MVQRRTGLVWRKGLDLAKDMLDRCQNPGLTGAWGAMVDLMKTSGG